MAKPLDLDLRERVVAAALSGERCREVAERLGVSAASVVKWTQRFRRTGSLASGKVGGHGPFLLEDERGRLLKRIEDEPDITVRQLADELAERGIVVSHVSVWNLLKREGHTFKKTVHASEKDRPDVARQRIRWRRHQHRIDPKRLVFIDETWTKTNMAPVRGWAPRGERLKERRSNRRALLDSASHSDPPAFARTRAPCTRHVLAQAQKAKSSAASGASSV